MIERPQEASTPPRTGDRRSRWFWWLVIPTGALFVVIFQFTPISYLANASHDDAWFVSKAISIATGHWFGDTYNSFSLMKGPGYPLFLVAVSASGLPIGVVEGALLAFSTGLLCWKIARLTGAYVVAGVLFTVILWHPVFLVPRLLREGIYVSELFLLLALTIEVFLLAETRRRRLIGSVLWGAAFAWLWLTREEGAWVFPGLAFLVAAIAFLSRRDLPRLRSFGLALAIMGVSAAALVSTFGIVNKFHYGAYQLVDFKDSGFTAALDALYSVQVGDPVQYLPISKRVRLEVYKVSPHFAELRDYFDGHGDPPWSSEGCRFFPQTCGDIAGGWIMWAVRDAAAAAGKYKTPDGASAFFAAIAQEVRDACSRGALTCRRSLISGLPYMTSSQYAELFPKFWLALENVMWASDVLGNHPPLLRSVGDRGAVESVSIFLNSRAISPSMQETTDQYTLVGWYMDPDHGWFTATAKDSDGRATRTSPPRRESPDLAAAFHDPAADRQRFEMPITCSARCMVEIRNDVTAVLSVRFSDLRQGRPIPVGRGQFYLDSIQQSGVAAAWNQDLRPVFARRLREAAASPYQWLGGAILIAAFLALLATMAVPAWRKTDVTGHTEALLVAISLWIFVAVRCLLLALIHVSLFPAITPNYLMPAYYLVWAAGGVSLLCFGRAVGADLRQRRRPAESIA